MTEYRPILVGEEEACLELWTQVFGVGRDYFERYFWGDPAWKPEYTRLCWEEGKLVSAVQMVRRELRLDGHVVPVAGIANVATHPEHRGKGHSTRLLQQAIQQMEGEDFLFSLLFTGIYDFYARLGWRRVPNRVWVGKPIAKELPDWQFRIAKENDLKSIMDWYEAFNARHPLTVVRSGAYWRGWSRWSDPTWRQGFYIGEWRGRPRGYLLMSQQEKRSRRGGVKAIEMVQVREVGCAPEDEECLLALLSFASTTAWHLNAKSWSLFLPWNGYDHLLPTVMDKPRRFEQGGAMVRLCGRDRLVQAFRKLGGSAIEPEAIPGDPALALRLLFGAYRGRLKGVDPRLQALFPPRPALYWQFDSF